ncbi:MAG: ABC transporter substrate-binding protein [Clostridiales bacterium]|nr:ABC transporter substrate-binding protein [Candidatus Crickella equi]
MKSYIKKAVAIVLALGMMLAMTACGGKDLSDQVRIGALVGPTGMGLINLQDDEKISMEIFQSPTDVVQKLVAGELDMACVPSNMGALLDAKTNGGVRILADIVNGGLFIVENGQTVQSLADLNGKTVVASGKGGTPEYVLAALLADAGLEINKDVKVQWLEDHAAVSQKVMATEGTIGLLPEPMKSTIISKNPAIRAAIDLDAAWNEMTGERLPMGIVIARKDFVDERTEDVDYLLEMVMDSVTAVQTKSDDVVNKIVEAGIIPDPDICKAVIDDDLLVFLSAEETKDILTPFYNTLFKMDPTAVGGKVPGDEIYYGIK